MDAMRDSTQQLDELIANSHHVSKWVEEQPSESQESWAQVIFAKLLDKSSQPRGASGNGCVKLCGFVEQSMKSGSKELHQWAFSKDMSLKLFTFYLEWNESDHHRSMRLVIDLLPQLIRKNPDAEASQRIKLEILNTLLSISTGKSTKPLVKSALKTLDHFLTKRTLTLDDILASYTSLHQERHLGKGLDIWKSFFFDVVYWMRLHFICPLAGRFIACLYLVLRRDLPAEQSLTLETWRQWLLEALMDEPSILEGMKNYMFLTLFKANKTDALSFLKMMNKQEAVSAGAGAEIDVPALLQLATLETGKKVGLVEEPTLGEADAKPGSPSRVILDERLLENVLAHPSHEVRSMALPLLISSSSTTRPYSLNALDMLRKHLGAYFSDPDAKFRNEVSAKVRDMFRRVRGAIFVLKKSIPRAAAKAKKQPEAAASGPKQAAYRANLIELPEDQLVECLKYHEDFLSWYLRFLCHELVPTASYQRHFASLKAVMDILRMEGESPKHWETPDDQELFFDQFGATWARALLDLIMDPFDDVREHAALVLKRIFSDGRYERFALISQDGTDSPFNELSEFLKRAQNLAQRTARADHSDGVARASQLLYKYANDENHRLSLLSGLIGGLEGKISVAEKDLGSAVLEAPLHGDFASLCSTWQVVSELSLSPSELEAVQSLQERLVSCCERAWAAVRGILCDDSPEGHLPQELEETDGLDTKDIISYSFRAVHEASNLMRTVVFSIRNRSREGRVHPSKQLYERIGNLSFIQLASLRHRGAFMTVASTFATCCQLVKHLDEQETSLLETWYNGTLEAISSQVSTTRRSAGIPAMMTGVLSANASNPSFEQVMARLMEIANQEAHVTETDGSNLPQVHAYNCLKDIFKSSYLTAAGNKSESYLPQCLELAANGLKSEVWAIRNCGLIFLRSLIDCLFGTHESKAAMEAGWDGKSNRIAYHRYTSLPGVLLALLKSGHQMMASTATGSAAAEAVFPALDIIRRAGPPDVLRDELQFYIVKYLASPVWHVREIAARTLCSCLLHETWLDAVTGLAAEAVNSSIGNTQNHVHGVLFALKYVVDRLQEVMPEQLRNDLPRLLQFTNNYWPQIQGLESPEIAAAYIEVMNIVRALPALQDDGRKQLIIPDDGKHESALLRKQRVIHGVYASFESGKPVENLRALLLGKHLGENSLIEGLEAVPRVWRIESLSGVDLNGLCDFFLDICLAVSPADPRVIALQNTNTVLDHLIKTDKCNIVSTSSLRQIWCSLAPGSMNPALANAATQISGSIVGILRQRQEISGHGLQNWGHLMADAGRDDKDFDTRLAAAESLCSFFAIHDASWSDESCLPALIALYDSLNDDDEDIRDTSAASAQAILGPALVPLEAAGRLLSWLAQNFGASAAFRKVVSSRIMGITTYPKSEAPEPTVEAELREALKFDDSLFAVEEQNLFIDEVRDTERWVTVFESISWETADPSLQKLTAWALGGLGSMQELTNSEDGPLGYASKPQVFAILSRVVQASAVLGRRHPDMEQRHKVHDLGQSLQGGSRHISGLLLRPLRTQTQ